MFNYASHLAALGNEVGFGLVGPSGNVEAKCKETGVRCIMQPFALDSEAKCEELFKTNPNDPISTKTGKGETLTKHRSSFFLFLLVFSICVGPHAAFD